MIEHKDVKGTAFPRSNKVAPILVPSKNPKGILIRKVVDMLLIIILLKASDTHIHS